MELTGRATPPRYFPTGSGSSPWPSTSGRSARMCMGYPSKMLISTRSEEFRRAADVNFPSGISYGRSNCSFHSGLTPFASSEKYFRPWKVIWM